MWRREFSSASRGRASAWRRSRPRSPSRVAARRVRWRTNGWRQRRREGERGRRRDGENPAQLSFSFAPFLPLLIFSLERSLPRIPPGARTGARARSRRRDRPQGSAPDGRTKEELQQAEVRQVGEQEREARDAQEEARYAEERKGPSPQGEEPRASNRDRPLRGARERRQGSAQEVESEEEQQPEEEHEQEIQLAEEEQREEKQLRTRA